MTSTRKTIVAESKNNKKPFFRTSSAIITVERKNVWR